MDDHLFQGIFYFKHSTYHEKLASKSYIRWHYQRLLQRVLSK
jgi:hypothetical protein